jgi:hypothetical protein
MRPQGRRVNPPANCLDFMVGRRIFGLGPWFYDRIMDSRII